MNKEANDKLLCRIAEGDTSAVSDFIDCYGGLLWSLALRFTNSSSDAEDAVQDVFIDLWKNAERFRPEIASEKTFVSMIARRRLIDRTRAKRLATSSDVDMERLPQVTPGVSDRVELKDEARLAEQILDQLPTDQSRAIRLAVFDGLTHSQIASETGLSLGTVKTHIRRGLIKIRERIGVVPDLEVKGGVA